MANRRYVILNHDHPFVHWDLMLEHEGALRTWRLYDEPALVSQTTAEPLSEHRLDYLEYEGPVSGDRGCVSRWDCGEYSTLQAEDDYLELQFSGQKLDGTASLCRQADHTWLFCYPV